MFGEYGVYCDEKFVALICDDTLFVKPTPISRHRIGVRKITTRYPRPYSRTASGYGR
jgi:TfoX/Sxy family transcriptional regulator of competence genes